MEEFLKHFGNPTNIYQLAVSIVAIISYGIFNEKRRNATVKDRNSHFSKLESQIAVMDEKLKSSSDKIAAKEAEIESIRDVHDREIRMMFESIKKKTDLVMSKRDLFETNRHNIIYDTIKSIRKASKGKFRIMKFEMDKKIKELYGNQRVIICPKFEDPCPLNKTITQAQTKAFEAALVSAIADGEDCAEALVANFPFHNTDDRVAKIDGNKEIHSAIADAFTTEIGDEASTFKIPTDYTYQYYSELIDTIRAIKRNEAFQIQQSQEAYEKEVNKIWGGDERNDS